MKRREHNIVCMCQSGNWSEIILPLNSKDAWSGVLDWVFPKALHHLCIFWSASLFLVSAPRAQAAAGCALAIPMALFFSP